ncbi:MAG: hypothetical protein ACYC6P_06315 [Ignavibacteriaceae bacterium]
MKTLKFSVALLLFVGLILIGCNENTQSPVNPSDQNRLEKATIHNFTMSDTIRGITGEGELKLTPGGIWQIKKYGFNELIVSADPLVNGTMVHYLSATFNAVTGEGPVQGSWTLTPTADVGGGVWEGIYQGYRSRSDAPNVYTIPLKLEGHGRGGTIDGMQFFSTVMLTVYTDGVTVLPTYWFGAGEGFYKSH